MSEPNGAVYGPSRDRREGRHGSTSRSHEELLFNSQGSFIVLHTLEACMNGNSTIAVERPAQRKFIAPLWHTLSILLIFAYFGYRAKTPSSVLGVGTGRAALTHGAMVHTYVISILSEWGMAWWVWAGVHFKGGGLRDLTGRRWKSWGSVALDVAIAIPFCGVWELTAWIMHRIVAGIPTATASYQPPSGVTEISLWILLSVSAGICEEIVFRGYLQQQFGIAARSVAAGVILQGVVFGLGHTYQGWKQVIVIAVLGILYGALVAWRRNLRASMISHAALDVFEGWLRFL